MIMPKRAVFLDKDGTLVRDVPYNVDPAHIELMPGAAEALTRLAAAGYELIVVSNQSGVARGYFEERALADVERRLAKLLAPRVSLAGFYWCPHHPEGSRAPYAVDCLCRKPRPGLLLRAAADHGVDLALSWFIGDILNDVEAGLRAGCRTVLLDNGHETEWQLSPLRRPHLTVPDLPSAAHAILAEDAGRLQREG